MHVVTFVCIPPSVHWWDMSFVLTWHSSLCWKAAYTNSYCQILATILLLLQGGITQGIPYTGNHSWSIVCLHLSSNHSWFTQQSGINQQGPGSEEGETWREMSINFAYKYRFHTVGIFNMLENLMRWNWWLYFPFKPSHATDFYCP
jgi:hypothetical protein